jgi:hypothetical protein
MKLAALFVVSIALQACVVCACCGAETDPNTLAAGAWSQPVGPKNGLKLRARLLVYAYPSQTGANPALYIELQDFSDSVGAVQEVYWDPGSLKCAMTDRDGKAVPESGGAFGGAAPGPMWIGVPTNSTIRLRVTPWGAGKLSDGGFALWAALPQTWELKAGDTNTYFFSGVLKSKPPKDHPSDNPQWIWSGTLELPKMEVTLKKLRDTKDER